jgi:hypothetical protein
LLVEREPLHDSSHIRREAADVAVQVGRELVGIVQQFSKIKPREVEERSSGYTFEQTADDRIGPALDLLVFLENPRLGRRKQAIEAPQHGQRQDHLAVLVPLIRAAELPLDAERRIGEHVIEGDLVAAIAATAFYRERA